MPQKKQLGLSELRVGLLVLASLAILIFVIFAVSGDINLFRRKTIVRTYMSSVDGLRDGAEVRLSGIKVGSVKELRFDRQIPNDPSASKYIEVIMEIDGRLDGQPAIERIRTDSMAILKGAGVLGDNVIDITPGTLKGQPIQDGGTIESVAQKSVGDIINAAQTAVSNFNAISADIKDITGRIKAGEGNIGRFLNDEAFYTNLNRVALQTEQLLTDVRRGEGTAGRLISDPALYNQLNDTVLQMRRLTDQVNEQLLAGRGTIGRLLKDEEIYNRANALVGKLDDTAARIERTAAKIERGEGNLGKLLNDERLYQDARAAVESFKTISLRLERGEGTAGLLLKDEQLYQNVNNVSAEVTKLLYDFRQNPRKYLSIKVSIF
jgi:phospholipid/cholesterol/gamma-HCH transport system substrate-binding protein